MKNVLVSLSLLCCFFTGIAQEEDLLEILEQEAPKTKKYVAATFKGTRILNGHSIENRKKGTLEFLISHRFGRINQGIDELFGLDQSNIRFAFEHGFTDNLMAGLGRSSFDKTYDGFVKYKFLHQVSEKSGMPLSASVFSSIAFRTLDDDDPENPLTTSQKLTYTTQVLFARKFSSGFSLQLSPTLIHRNSVQLKEDPHTIFALGVGTRVKLSKRMSVNAEYFYSFDEFTSINAKNSLALGIDIETGGHIFQLILSNAITMIEKSFITETTGDFFSGDIHFGFNISRAFEIGKQKKNKTKQL